MTDLHQDDDDGNDDDYCYDDYYYHHHLHDSEKLSKYVLLLQLI